MTKFGVENLRFLRKDNLESERRLQSEYFRDQINSFGVDVLYFRKDNSFYNIPSGYCNYTYGEDTTATYYLSAPMVVYMEMMGDSFLLDKFGIQTDGDANISIHIEDFYEQFRDMIGTTTNKILTGDLYATVENYSGIISGDMISDDLTAVTSGYFESSMSGYVSGDYNNSVIVAPRAVNPDIAWPNYYSEEYGLRYLAGVFSGQYEGVLDLSGNGILTGHVSGDGYFFESPALPQAPHWEVDPQVGDFFRICFDENNHEEYSITRVKDRDLNTDGLNPLLEKYIWKCDVVRRDPSYEVVEGEQQEEEHTESKIGQNKWHETESNEIFDYATSRIDDVDGKNSDKVYGDYGM